MPVKPTPKTVIIDSAELLPDWKLAAEAIVVPLHGVLARGSALIGRERELAALRAELDRARAATLRVALLRGEAGIGKTTLLAARYLLGITWSIIPGWCFIAIRNFMGAVNRPEPGLWITLVAIPVNAFLAYALIHGHFGLPRLDLLGAGIATTLVNIGTCAVAIWVCYARHPFKKYRVLGRFWRADWRLLGQLFVIGFPISIGFMLE